MLNNMTTSYAYSSPIQRTIKRHYIYIGLQDQTVC